MDQSQEVANLLDLRAELLQDAVRFVPSSDLQKAALACRAFNVAARANATQLTLPIATLSEATQQAVWEQQQQTAGLRAATPAAADGSRAASHLGASAPAVAGSSSASTSKRALAALAAPAPSADKSAASAAAAKMLVASEAPAKDLAAHAGSADASTSTWKAQPQSKRQRTAAHRGGCSRSTGQAAPARALQLRMAQPASGMLHRLLGIFPNVRHVTLEHNSTVTMQELNKQLGLLRGLSQLESLELRDAYRWSLPSPMPQLGELKQLTHLKLLLQSPGIYMGPDVIAGMEGDNMLGHVSGATINRLCAEVGVVSRLTQLRQLQLRFVCGERGFFTTDAFMTAVSGLTNLTRLDLAYVKVAAGSMAQLAPLVHLQELVVYGDFLGLATADFLHFGGMRNLRRLELFHDGILPNNGRDELPVVTPGVMEALKAAFSGLRDLTWLNLPVSTWTEGVMPLLQHLPGLREVYLQNIDVVHDAQYQQGLLSLGLTGLKVLQLDNIALREEVLVGLNNMTGLHQLILFNIQPHLSQSQMVLTGLTGLTTMRHFCFDTVMAPQSELSLPLLQDDACRVLGTSWPDLDSLHFSFSHSTTVQLTLSELRSFRRLRDLSLSSSRRIDEVTIQCDKLPDGLRSLCLTGMILNGLPQLPTSLKHLWISNACVDPLDFRLLPQRLPSLETLVVRRLATTQLEVWSLKRRDLGLLGALTNLKTLGLTLPAGLTQLQRGLSRLVGLERLILDYEMEAAEMDVRVEVDTDALFVELSALGCLLTRLQGLWLSDNCLGMHSAWQHLLQKQMPHLCIRSCMNDWFWHTGFPIGSCLDVDNPIEWWKFTPWNIL